MVNKLERYEFAMQDLQDLRATLSRQKKLSDISYEEMREDQNLVYDFLTSEKFAEPLLEMYTPPGVDLKDIGLVHAFDQFKRFKILTRFALKLVLSQKNEYQELLDKLGFDPQPMELYNSPIDFVEDIVYNMPIQAFYGIANNARKIAPEFGKSPEELVKQVEFRNRVLSSIFPQKKQFSDYIYLGMDSAALMSAAGYYILDNLEKGVSKIPLVGGKLKSYKECYTGKIPEKPEAILILKDLRNTIDTRSEEIYGFSPSNEEKPYNAAPALNETLTGKSPGIKVLIA